MFIDNPLRSAVQLDANKEEDAISSLSGSSWQMCPTRQQEKNEYFLPLALIASIPPSLRPPARTLVFTFPQPRLPNSLAISTTHAQNCHQFPVVGQYIFRVCYVLCWRSNFTVVTTNMPKHRMFSLIYKERHFQGIAKIARVCLCFVFITK